MKFKYLILIMVLVVSGYSQTKYSGSRGLFREVMSKGSSIVGFMESKDLEIVKIDVDLISTSREKQVVKEFSNSYSYLISVQGQPSVIESMTILLYRVTSDARTVFVASSDDSLNCVNNGLSICGKDNCPRIVFKPSHSGDYLISMRVNKMVPGSTNPMGYFFLAVAHD